MNHSTNTIRRAEQILGYGIGTGTGVREYPVIDGVIYTDLFEGDLNVELPFEYKLAFNGKMGHTSYYNEIIVKSRCKSTVEVDAIWGSCEFDKEIKSLLDWLEAKGIVDTGYSFHIHSMNPVGVQNMRVIIEEAAAHRMQEWAAAGCSVFMPEQTPGILPEQDL